MKRLSVAIVVTQDFSPFHLSVPMIVFSDAVTDEKYFDLVLCSEKVGTVTSPEGFSVTVTADYGVLRTADIVIVPFWSHPSVRPTEGLLKALVNAKKRDAEIVGLCLGSYVLAYAGILDGLRASTHWEYEKNFQASFPLVKLDVNSLYVDDESIITSAGTAAALDCCLYVIRKRLGSAVANQIARRMIVPPHRDGGQAQYIEQPIPSSTTDERVNNLIDHLMKNIDAELNIDSLAEYVCMSRRSLTRHFMKVTGVSVGNWIIAERLRRSQLLLESSNLTIEQIAEKVGFQSAITYRQHFKLKYNVSPSEWRKTFQVS